MGGFDLVNDDILQNILSRLPTSSFASAACVSKTWNKVSDAILSCPKLASALSLNPSLSDAVKEVLDKVLSEPIRPQFAIASIGLHFSLEAAHQLIIAKLGSNVPVITNTTYGIIGRDAITNSRREVRWQMIPEEDGTYSQEAQDFNRGIVLIVGFLPGLKVDTIPLLRLKKEPFTLIDKFLMDIKDYTASVSGSIAPTGIILFGDKDINLTPILAEIDCAMPEETVIVGDASSRFLCSSGYNSQTYNNVDLFYFDVVALVFAKDKNKPQGIGETRFYATLSPGIVPFGPELKAIAVTSKGSECSWVTASINGFDQILDSQSLLEDINNEMEDEGADLYIGVIQKRPSFIEPEKLELRKYLAFYEVLGGDELYLVVDGVGIRPGDTFLFYHSDMDTASSSCFDAFENLKVLLSAKSCYSTKDAASSSSGGSGGGHGGGCNGKVFGGLIFSAHNGGESYYESFPFYSNFPGAPLAGMICNREIGRDPATASVWQEDKQESAARCSLHVFTTVYLVFSYVPPSPNLLN